MLAADVVVRCTMKLSKKATAISFKDLTGPKTVSDHVSPVRLAECTYEHGDAGQVDALALS